MNKITFYLWSFPCYCFCQFLTNFNKNTHTFKRGSTEMNTNSNGKVRFEINTCVYTLFCRKNREEYLKSLTRDNTQLLINTLWQVRILRKNKCTRFEKSVDLTKIIMHSLIHFTCSFQQRK